MEGLWRSALPLRGGAPGAAHSLSNRVVITDALLADGSRVDIRVEDGTIREIAGARALPGTTIDLGGALLVPGFVDGHIHLDKTLLGLPFQPHRPGHTVAARIAREKELRRELAYPVEERAKQLIRRVVGHGTIALRSHVDVDTE